MNSKEKLKIFPWLGQFSSLAYKCFSKNSSKHEEVFANLYHHVSLEISNILQNDDFKRAEKLCEVLSAYIFSFHMSDITFNKDHKVPKKSFIKLVSCLVDLDIFLCRGDTSSPYHEHCVRHMFLLTGSDVYSLWDIVLQCVLLDRKHLIVLLPILRRIMQQLPESIHDPVDYMKMILLLRRWRKFCHSEEDKREVLSLAYKVTPPDDLHHWLSTLQMKTLPKMQELGDKDLAKYFLCKAFRKGFFKEMRAVLNNSTADPNTDFGFLMDAEGSSPCEASTEMEGVLVDTSGLNFEENLFEEPESSDDDVKSCQKKSKRQYEVKTKGFHNDGSAEVPSEVFFVDASGLIKFEESQHEKPEVPNSEVAEKKKKSKKKQKVVKSGKVPSNSSSKMSDNEEQTDVDYREGGATDLICSAVEKNEITADSKCSELKSLVSLSTGAIPKVSKVRGKKSKGNKSRENQSEVEKVTTMVEECPGNEGSLVSTMKEDIDTGESSDAGKSAKTMKKQKKKRKRIAEEINSLEDENKISENLAPGSNVLPHKPDTSGAPPHKRTKKTKKLPVKDVPSNSADVPTSGVTSVLRIGLEMKDIEAPSERQNMNDLEPVEGDLSLERVCSSKKKNHSSHMYAEGFNPALDIQTGENIDTSPVAEGGEMEQDKHLVSPEYNSSEFVSLGDKKRKRKFKKKKRIDTVSETNDLAEIKPKKKLNKFSSQISAVSESRDEGKYSPGADVMEDLQNIDVEVAPSVQISAKTERNAKNNSNTSKHKGDNEVQSSSALHSSPEENIAQKEKILENSFENCEDSVSADSLGNKSLTESSQEKTLRRKSKTKKSFCDEFVGICEKVEGSKEHNFTSEPSSLDISHSESKHRRKRKETTFDNESFEMTDCQLEGVKRKEKDENDSYVISENVEVKKRHDSFMSKHSSLDASYREDKGKKLHNESFEMANSKLESIERKEKDKNDSCDGISENVEVKGHDSFTGEHSSLDASYRKSKSSSKRKEKKLRNESFEVDDSKLESAEGKEKDKNDSCDGISENVEVKGHDSFTSEHSSLDASYRKSKSSSKRKEKKLESFEVADSKLESAEGKEKDKNDSCDGISENVEVKGHDSFTSEHSSLDASYRKSKSSSKRKEKKLRNESFEVADSKLESAEGKEKDKNDSCDGISENVEVKGHDSFTSEHSSLDASYRKSKCSSKRKEKKLRNESFEVDDSKLESAEGKEKDKNDSCDGISENMEVKGHDSFTSEHSSLDASYRKSKSSSKRKEKKLRNESFEVDDSKLESAEGKEKDKNDSCDGISENVEVKGHDSFTSEHSSLDASYRKSKCSSKRKEKKLRNESFEAADSKLESAEGKEKYKNDLCAGTRSLSSDHIQSIDIKNESHLSCSIETSDTVLDVGTECKNGRNGSSFELSERKNEGNEKYSVISNEGPEVLNLDKEENPDAFHKNENENALNKSVPSSVKNTIQDRSDDSGSSHAISLPCVTGKNEDKISSNEHMPNANSQVTETLNYREETEENTRQSDSDVDFRTCAVSSSLDSICCETDSSDIPYDYHGMPFSQQKIEIVNESDSSCISFIEETHDGKTLDSPLPTHSAPNKSNLSFKSTSPQNQFSMSTSGMELVESHKGSAHTEKVSDSCSPVRVSNSVDTPMKSPKRDSCSLAATETNTDNSSCLQKSPSKAEVVPAIEPDGDKLFSDSSSDSEFDTPLFSRISKQIECSGGKSRISNKRASEKFKHCSPENKASAKDFMLFLEPSSGDECTSPKMSPKELSLSKPPSNSFQSEKKNGSMVSELGKDTVADILDTDVPASVENEKQPLVPVLHATDVTNIQTSFSSREEKNQAVRNVSPSVVADSYCDAEDNIPTGVTETPTRVALDCDSKDKSCKTPTSVHRVQVSPLKNPFQKSENTDGAKSVELTSHPEVTTVKKLSESNTLEEPGSVNSSDSDSDCSPVVPSSQIADDHKEAVKCSSARKYKGFLKISEETLHSSDTKEESSDAANTSNLVLSPFGATSSPTKLPHSLTKLSPCSKVDHNLTGDKTITLSPVKSSVPCEQNSSTPWSKNLSEPMSFPASPQTSSDSQSIDESDDDSADEKKENVALKTIASKEKFNVSVLQSSSRVKRRKLYSARVKKSSPDDKRSSPALETSPCPSSKVLEKEDSNPTPLRHSARISQRQSANFPGGRLSTTRNKNSLSKVCLSERSSMMDVRNHLDFSDLRTSPQNSPINKNPPSSLKLEGSDTGTTKDVSNSSDVKSPPDVKTNVPPSPWKFRLRTPAKAEQTSPASSRSSSSNDPESHNSSTGGEPEPPVWKSTARSDGGLFPAEPKQYSRKKRCSSSENGTSGLGQSLKELCLRTPCSSVLQRVPENASPTRTPDQISFVASVSESSSKSSNRTSASVEEAISSSSKSPPKSKDSLKKMIYNEVTPSSSKVKTRGSRIFGTVKDTEVLASSSCSKVKTRKTSLCETSESDKKGYNLRSRKSLIVSPKLNI